MSSDTNTPSKQKKLFCFGYGYVAQHFVRELKRQGDNWKVIGTTTDPDKLDAMRTDGVKPLLFSDIMPFSDPLLALKDVTHILISIPPKSDGDIVFKLHARDILQTASVQWIGYLSSTGVYGNRDGDWVDETAEIRPISERGSKRAKAETQWLKLRRLAGIPINIFRLGGIYGPGRSALDTVGAGNVKRVYKEGHAFNRIHVDDIARGLIASINHSDTSGDVYNLVDDNPAQSHELIEHACQLLGKTPSPLLEFDEDLDISPMARSFYKDNKRVSNQKVKDKLGLTFKYPDFKSGLDAIYKSS